jgi:hypothetical protein
MEIVRRGRETHVGQKIVSSSWTSLPKRFPGSVRSIVCYPGCTCAPGRQGMRAYYPPPDRAHYRVLIFQSELWGGLGKIAAYNSALADIRS